MPDENMPVEPEPSLAENMMTLARSVRLYYQALTAEGFNGGEAVHLALAWQMNLLSGTQEAAAVTFSCSAFGCGAPAVAHIETRSLVSDTAFCADACLDHYERFLGSASQWLLEQVTE